MRVLIENNVTIQWDRFSNLRFISIYMLIPITSEHLVGLTKLQHLEKIYLYVPEISQDALNVCEDLPITRLYLRDLRGPLPNLELLKRWKKLRILGINNIKADNLKPLLDSKLYCRIRIKIEKSYECIRGPISEVYVKLKNIENVYA